MSRRKEIALVAAGILASILGIFVVKVAKAKNAQLTLNMGTYLSSVLLVIAAFLLGGLLEKLKTEYGCERITIQSGGTLNGIFLREKLFDYLDIVVAPVLIGGKDTATLIDGDSLRSQSQLSQLGVLKLQECVVLENSYLRLRYEVVR